MDVIEVPGEPPDDLYLARDSWAAPRDHHPTTAEYALSQQAGDLTRERDKARALNAALGTEIRNRDATIEELARRKVAVEETAVIERAHRIRLERDNKALNQRLELLQRANERRGTADLGQTDGRPHGVLQDGNADAQPVPSRWAPFARGKRS
jgi:hypothetical protein